MASASGVSGLDFNNTEIAFRSRSNLALRKAQFLFKSFNGPLVTAGPHLVNFALSLHLPVKPLIKATIFDQFCGGETIDDCAATLATLARDRVGAVLDYSVEGREREGDFDDTMAEVLRLIAQASRNTRIPFTVFKVTGLIRFDLLAKLQAKATLSAAETSEWERGAARVRKLGAAAAAAGVRILVDAEETWIQDPIDELVIAMMRQHNKGRAVVFNTLQMYRRNRLAFLERLHGMAVSQGFVAGVKLVRGAYMEKERARAASLGLPSPIQADKAANDRDFDAALRLCVEHVGALELFAGSHNEASNRLLADLMAARGIAPQDRRIEFSQLLGMSDHLTYNLADGGYNVSKYVPYGPVRAVMPYLFRRAAENSSIKGQASRELQLIERELRRRAGQS